MHRILMFLVAWSPVAFLCGAEPSAEPSQEPSRPVVFCAMGDVPYAPEEDTKLREQLAELPDEAEFLVHLGDIKTGHTPCNEDVYNKVYGILSQSPAPVFIIPGDNEWNDCADPALGWRHWQKYFSRFDRRWPHQFRVFRQLEREENLSFVHRDVLFVGLNLVGGRVHDEQEWRRRHAENADWCRRNLRHHALTVTSAVVLGHAKPMEKHDDFFGELVAEARRFEKPILYLHGDGHRWIRDRPFEADNILRVQVDQGGIAPPVQVTVTSDPREPFQFDRRQLPTAAE